MQFVRKNQDPNVSFSFTEIPTKKRFPKSKIPTLQNIELNLKNVNIGTP